MNRLYISLSFGFSLAVNAWIFFRVSGGLFNPAVSLGMVLVGALTPLRGALLAFAQILGGMTVSARPSTPQESSDETGVTGCGNHSSDHSGHFECPHHSWRGNQCRSRTVHRDVPHVVVRLLVP